MKSMTGYGHAKHRAKTSDVEASVRTVNGRFLEIRFHLPREYYFLEADLKKLVEGHISRGTVDIFINRKNRSDASLAEVKINKGLLSEYAKAYNEVAASLKVTVPPHPELFLRFPDVVILEVKEDELKNEAKSVSDSLKMALDLCDENRLREGTSLQKELSALLAQLGKFVKEIEVVRVEANKTLQDRLENKLKAKIQGVEIDQNRIAAELVIMLEKSDINEELSRLQNHMEHYSDLLKKEGPIGKQLDFYTQELLREVNTIGSKSGISKLTQLVVETKTIIERLREQVQNIE